MHGSTIFLLLLLGLNHLSAQTCCSGGVPVSSNLGFNAAESQTLQWSLSADFNVLDRLYAGNQQLTDGLRKRSTQSFLLRAAYAFHPKWSVEGLFATVRQTRQIYTNNNEEDFEASFGIGDPVVLLIYNLTTTPVTWRVGAGPQIPLGSTTKRNDRNLFLVEDLQPGSGAWDAIFFSALEYQPRSRPNRFFYLNAIYSLTGENPNSRNGAQTYEFGNDLQLIAGVSEQFLLGSQLLTPGIGLRFRTAERDRIDGFANTGTGGDFLFLRLSAGWDLPKNFRININVERTLYTFVNETQLATRYLINAGFYKSLRFNQSSEPSPKIF